MNTNGSQIHGPFTVVITNRLNHKKIYYIHFVGSVFDTVRSTHWNSCSRLENSDGKVDFLFQLLQVECNNLLDLYYPHFIECVRYRFHKSVIYHHQQESFQWQTSSPLFCLYPQTRLYPSHCIYYTYFYVSPVLHISSLPFWFQGYLTSYFLYIP